jgi:hypothetical protein
MFRDKNHSFKREFTLLPKELGIHIPLNLDPYFLVNPNTVRSQVFAKQELREIFAKKFKELGSKVAMYLFLSLHEGLLSYRRRLQPSKEYMQN